MSPAGSAVGLVAHVVDNVLALWPGSSSIEAFWKVSTEAVRLLDVGLDSPFWVDNGTEDLLNLLEAGSLELGVDASSPGGLRV